MAKNVLPKHWNGSEFEELHIVTKASNVFTNDNKSVQQKIDDFTSHSAEVASKTKYGHVKIGNGIDVSNGIISVSDMTASNVSIADVANNFESTTVEGALSELFTNVSDGKSLIGGAITDVDPDVIVPAEPTFQDLANAINSLKIVKYASGSGSYNNADGDYVVSGLDFTPDIAIYEIRNIDDPRYHRNGILTRGFELFERKAIVSAYISGSGGTGYGVTTTEVRIFEGGFSAPKAQLSSANAIYWKAVKLEGVTL